MKHIAVIIERIFMMFQKLYEFHEFTQVSITLLKENYTLGFKNNTKL
jgi:hypothetical protein